MPKVDTQATPATKAVKPKNLQTAIAQAIAAGKLPTYWTTGDLAALHAECFPSYSPRTLETVPPTRSADAAGNPVGHGVGDPAKAPFIRFEQDEGPLLFCLREHFEDPQRAAPTPAPAVQQAAPDPARPVLAVAPRLTAPVAPPGDYATFLRSAQPLFAAADAVIADARLGPVTGWPAWLAAYRWKSSEPQWEKGVADRMANRDAVQAMRSGRRPPADVYVQIVKTWGGISQPLGQEWDAPIARTMDALLAAPDAPAVAGACGRRIASVSKLYAALAPEAWVIYDSRVAAALAYLALAGGVAAGYRDWFVVMPAKGKAERLVPGFRVAPAAKKGSFEQPEAFRAFVLGSWFCRAMADRLNQASVPLPDGRVGGWTAYHVEMVLFMVGADLRALPMVVASPEP